MKPALRVSPFKVDLPPGTVLIYGFNHGLPAIIVTVKQYGRFTYVRPPQWEMSNPMLIIKIKSVLVYESH